MLLYNLLHSLRRMSCGRHCNLSSSNTSVCGNISVLFPLSVHDYFIIVEVAVALLSLKL